MSEDILGSDATNLASKVPASRSIIAGTGLIGGGDLSADRTLSTTGVPTVINVKDPAFGAVGDGVTNDSSAFAAAASAAAGGVLYMPPGTYNANVALTNRNDLTLRGAGAGTVIAPASGTGLAISHCSRFLGESFRVSGGTTGITADGISLGRLQGVFIDGCSGDGLYINGDSATEAFFNDVMVKDVGAIGIHYARTTLTDTGGVYFDKCLATRSTAGLSGWKFESSAGSATKAYAWLQQCVCDGFPADDGFIIDNIDDVRTLQMWVVAGSPGKSLIRLTNAHQILFTDPRFYQNSSTGNGIEFAGTTQYVKVRGGALESTNGAAALVFTGGTINDIVVDKHVRVGGWTAKTTGTVNTPTGVLPRYRAASASPTPTTLVANTLYYAAVEIPDLCKITGIAWHNDATISGNFKVALYDSAGTQVAVSASTAGSGAFLNQRAAFTTAYIALPGIYYLSIQCDNATATIAQVHVFGSSGSVAPGSFAPPGSITPPAATASTKMPDLSTY